MKRKEGKSKKQARFLCILLTFVMLLGMLPMTALAADETTYITEVTVTGVQTPVVGQPCSVDTIVITTNPANAYITEGTGAVNIYWYDETDRAYMGRTDIFIKGHRYHLSVELEPKEGYAFGFKYSTSPFWKNLPYTGTATVNGKKADRAERLDDSNTGLFVCSDTVIVPVEALTTYGITVTNGRASIGTGSEITSASENDVITLTADTAPEGKTFDKWVVDEGSTAITLADMNSASTTFTMPAGAVSITAMYKDIQQSGGDNDPVYYTLTFDKNGGSGSMADVKVDKGSMYSLPACKFTAPAGKEFKAWEVGGVEKAVGDSIAVNADTKVKAIWQKNGVSDKTSPKTGDNGMMYVYALGLLAATSGMLILNARRNKKEQ